MTFPLILGPELTQYTLESAPRLSTENDEISWKLTSCGEFTLQSSWNSFRSPRRECRVARVVGFLLAAQSKLVVWKLLKGIFLQIFWLRDRVFNLFLNLFLDVFVVLTHWKNRFIISSLKVS